MKKKLMTYNFCALLYSLRLTICASFVFNFSVYDIAGQNLAIPNVEQIQVYIPMEKSIVDIPAIQNNGHYIFDGDIRLKIPDEQGKEGNTDELIDSKIDEDDYSLLNKYNHEYTVDLIPQVTGVTCWAASTAMIVGWLDNVNISVQEIVEGVGYWAQYDNENYSIDKSLASFDLNMFEVWGLVPDTRYTYSLESIADLLWNYGPLWVASDEKLTSNSSSNGHIRVIGGISGDGSEGGTLLKIYDPWDRNSNRFRRGNSGSVYQETYSEFIFKMDHLVKKEKSKDAIYLAHP